jgi:methionyl-tRNA synthetase
MSAASDFRSMVAFGIDNAVLLLMGSIAVLSSYRELKPFDHVLTNYFYHLQGRKFSTSRRHAIWAADIVSMTPARSDAVRLFLGLHSPEQSATNFDVPAFIEFVNRELAGTLERHVIQAQEVIREAGGLQALRGTMPDRLKGAISVQRALYELPGMSLPRICGQLVDWWNVEPGLLASPGDAYGWLKGLAILAWPVMPQLATRIWAGLGMVGEPSIERPFEYYTDPQSFAEGAGFERISFESLSACLPETMLVCEPG